jgi:hypothetical protein
MAFSWLAIDWKPTAMAFWSPAAAELPCATESTPSAVARYPSARLRSPFAFAA